MIRLTSTCLACLIVLLNISIAFGQSPDPEATRVTQSGTASTASGRKPSPQIAAQSTPSATATPDLTYKMYLPETFSIYNSNTEFAFALGGRYVTAGQASFGRQLDLPQGAQLYEVTIYFVDNAPGDISYFLYEQSPDSIIATPLGNASTSGTDSDAIRSVTITGSPITTIDNAQHAYNVEMNLPSYTSNHRIQGIRVGFKFQAVFLPITPRRE